MLCAVCCAKVILTKVRYRETYSCLPTFLLIRSQLLYYNKRVCISVVCIWALLELVRLSFGYRGNLKENVSC